MSQISLHTNIFFINIIEYSGVFKIKRKLHANETDLLICIIWHQVTPVSMKRYKGRLNVNKQSFSFIILNYGRLQFPNHSECKQSTR